MFACVCGQVVSEDEKAVRWCQGWPSRGLESLTHEGRAKLHRNLTTGLMLTTRFSGLEAPTLAAAMIEDAASTAMYAGNEFVGFSLESCGDWACQAQACLTGFCTGGCRWSKHKPGHVFGDIADMVTKEAYQEMLSIVEALPQKPREQQQKQFMLDLMNPLLHKGGLKKTVPCVLHKGMECPRRSNSSELELKLKVHAAGSPCVDWSRRGKWQGPLGETAIPHAIWLAEVIDSGIELLIHECTPDYPDWMLLDALQHYSSRQWKMIVLRICPTMLGIPARARRKRRYSIAWHSGKINFSGSNAEFFNLFLRLCELKGSIFFQDGACISVTDSKTKHQCLQMYHDICTGMMRGNPAAASSDNADLSQRPPFGSLDSMLPCLTTGSTLYSLSKQKFLTAREALRSHGNVRGPPRSGRAALTVAREGLL